MGSPCELWFYTDSVIHGQDVVKTATNEVARLDAKYSRYHADSITCRINRAAGTGKGVAVDDETAALIDYAAEAYAQSSGLFDITSGVLQHVWSFDSSVLPSQAAIDRQLALIGWPRVKWRQRVIELPEPGMEIDLGGCMKEYAADRLVELCHALDIRHGMVDLGGDIAIIGPHPDGSCWRVGIRHPRYPDRPKTVIEVGAGAVATSCDYERYMIVDGKRYCDLLNPKTGWPVDGLQAVSVLADNCMLAGAFATIAMLKGSSEGPQWLDEVGLATLRIDAAGRTSGALSLDDNLALHQWK